MNQKLAKKIRRIAKGLWQNSGATSFEEYMETKYTENISNRKISTTYEQNSDGTYVTDEKGMLKIKNRQVVSDGTISVILKCFRGQYLSMKKAIAA
jgi:hypothetical protein